MHAWVWRGAARKTGWVGLDPTNAASLAAHEHVTLAVGRDYTDVAPIDGVIIASGRPTHAMSAVSVTPV